MLDIRLALHNTPNQLATITLSGLQGVASVSQVVGRVAFDSAH